MNTLPDIRQIQLITGVSIVGYIVEETEKLLAVETPFEIIRSGHTAEWALYLHMCDDDHIIDINKDHVICSFECNQHFKIQYIQMLDRLTKQEQPVIDDDDGDYVKEYDTNNNTVH